MAIIYPIGCCPTGNNFEKRNIVSRMWKKFLSAYEFTVLDTIFDRTTGWGKEKESIPVRHFLEGFSKGNKFVCTGSSMSEKSVKRVLKSLEDNGYITVERNNGTRKPNKYSINFSFIPEGFLMLRPRKEDLNPVQNDELKGLADPTNDELKGLTDPTKEVEDFKKEEASSANAQDEALSTPRERAQKALNQSLTKKRKSRVTRSRKNTPDGWETVWRDEYKKCYPGSKIPKWRGKEYGIMKNIHKRLNDDFVKSGDNFNDFLRFCVRRWLPVLQTKGSGIAEYKPSNRRYSQIPREPSLIYLSPCVDMFTRAFDREGNSKLANLSDEDKAIAEIMAKEDLTHSEAFKVYAERQASAKASDRISRKTKELEYCKKEFAKKQRQEAFLRSSQKYQPKTHISPKKVTESSPRYESADNWRKTGGIQQMSDADKALHSEPLPAWE